MPIKCEKYTRTEEGLAALREKISHEFASTIGLMKNPAYSGKLSVEIIPVQTAGNADFSKFTLHDDKDINAGNIARIKALMKEIESLRKKIADDESKYKRESIHLKAQSARDVEGLNAKIKAVKSERDKALANLDAALKSEASALEAKSEAEKIMRDYSRLIESEVSRAVESVKISADKETAKLKNEIESLRKAEAERRGQENKDPRTDAINAVICCTLRITARRLLSFSPKLRKKVMLCVMYYNGRGVSEDKARAKEFARRAAIHGSAAGQCNYGDSLSDEENYAEAKVFYEMSAEQDYIPSITALGLMYFYGRGVEQDFSKAFKWFMKAAEGGNLWVQHNVAYSYEGGYGVAKDINKAREWYTRAAEQGNEDAKKWISEHKMNGEISRDKFRKLCGSSAGNMRFELERLRVPSDFRFTDGDKSAIVRTLLENGAKIIVNGKSTLDFTTDYSMKNLLRQYQ